MMVPTVFETMFPYRSYPNSHQSKGGWARQLTYSMTAVFHAVPERTVDELTCYLSTNPENVKNNDILK
jgi:hypothetical protein